MLKKSKNLILLLLGLLYVTTGIAQVQPQLTPEQQLELLKLLLTSRNGQAARLQPPQAPATSPELKTETELAAVFSNWKKPEKGVVFERFRDGFSINGVRHVDPEGMITTYGFDVQTGDFTYFAQTAPGQFVLKSGRALTDAEPVPIATAERRGGVWSVSTVTGRKFNGHRLIALARGFIVARDNTGFRYIPGQGTTNIVAPEQFAIAGLQNGDVSSTGYILLERMPSEEGGGGSGAVGALFGSFKALGSALGVSKKEDYALLHIDSKKIVPINIPIEGKQVHLMKACRQRNALVSECERMESYESVFDRQGLRNMSHYFWRITWLNGEGRPVLISQEGGLSKISATDLTSGKRVILFERGLGIADFAVSQKTDGKISISAQMGLSRETRDDVVALLDTMPDDSSKDDASKSNANSTSVENGASPTTY